MKGRKRSSKSKEPKEEIEFKPPVNWTEEEDRILIEKAAENKCKNWNAVASCIEGRTAIQCSARFKRIQPGIIKGAWTEKEDKQLLDLYKDYGKNWSLISKSMATRTGKQIRDRFLNGLDKNLIKDKFTPEEDEKIIKHFNVYGSSWCKIAKKIKGRTGDMVKNRFYSSLKKVIQEGKGRKLLGKKRKKDKKPKEDKPKPVASENTAKKQPSIQVIPNNIVIEHTEVNTGASDNTEANDKNNYYYSSNAINKVKFNCEIIKEDMKKIEKNEAPVTQNIKEPYQLFKKNSAKLIKMPNSYDRSNTNQNEENDYYISEKKIKKPLPILHYRNDIGTEIDFIGGKFGRNNLYSQSSYLIPAKTEQLRGLIFDYVNNGNKKDNLMAQMEILKEIKADTHEKLRALNLSNKNL